MPQGSTKLSAEMPEPYSWRVGRTDLEFPASPRAVEPIEREGVVPLGHQPLRTLGEARGPAGSRHHRSVAGRREG